MNLPKWTLIISELYDRTCKTVVSNPQNWQNFLQSACRNYKLRYDEQLLIYAQRPDATAVLEIERWNRSFGRWVNKGARGIAVFADENRARQRLTHYFDISDTHESRYSRPVPLWDMRDEYTDDVIETLESTFGELDNKVTLGDAVMSAAQNAAEDNLPDYLNDLIYASEDSFLEGLDETMIASLYSYANAVEFSTQQAQRLGWDSYGDTQYPAHVLRYYPYGRAFTAGGNQAIVEVALTQIGNQGGQPYWSWYGFDSRVEWCACFVSWCADQCGYIESGLVPKFAGCVDGANWFKSNGKWQNRTYEPKAGDIIFFDWEGDGTTDHVGIVEKCENGTVYTVEGNSGDACKQRQYAVGSSNIYGYGIPAY